MASIIVNVEQSILKWVLAQTKEERLGEKLLVSVKDWLDGKKKPTFRQVEELSRKSNIPLGYFFLQQPPSEHIPLLEYRTVDSVKISNPSRDLIDTIKDMGAVQGWMADYRKERGFEQVKVAGSLKGKNKPESIARKMREDLGIKASWYQDLNDSRQSFRFFRNKLEENAVLVMMNGVVRQNTHRPLNSNEFRAFAMSDKWAPLIFINANDSHGARLFSLLHEAVHIWMGENDLYNDRHETVSHDKGLEALCNAAAAEILVPIEDLKKMWEETSNVYDDEEQIVSQLAKIFCCGETVIARRALEQKFISKSVYQTISARAIQNYQKLAEKKSGGSYYNTKLSRLDRMFVHAIAESVMTGRVTYTEAYRLTATNDKTFPEMLRRMEGVGV